MGLDKHIYVGKKALRSCPSFCVFEKDTHSAVFMRHFYSNQHWFGMRTTPFQQTLVYFRTMLIGQTI